MVAENNSWSAATATLTEPTNSPLLPAPLDLVIIDVPDSDRASTALTAFEMLSKGGIMIVQEPEVPTGDVGVPEPGQQLTDEQISVEAFNSWIEFVKLVSESHSLGFVELLGGNLAVFRKN